MTKVPMTTVQEICHTAAGLIVRNAREETGKSLRWLATKMGISAPFLSDLERGRRNWTAVRYDEAMKILRKVVAK